MTDPSATIATAAIAAGTSTSAASSEVTWLIVRPVSTTRRRTLVSRSSAENSSLGALAIGVMPSAVRRSRMPPSALTRFRASATAILAISAPSSEAVMRRLASSNSTNEPGSPRGGAMGRVTTSAGRETAGADGAEGSTVVPSAPGDGEQRNGESTDHGQDGDAGGHEEPMGVPASSLGGLVFAGVARRGVGVDQGEVGCRRCSWLGDGGRRRRDLVEELGVGEERHEVEHGRVVGEVALVRTRPFARRHPASGDRQRRRARGEDRRAPGLAVHEPVGEVLLRVLQRPPEVLAQFAVELVDEGGKLVGEAGELTAIASVVKSTARGSCEQGRR
ncbi:MAG: hypothetical protein R2710_21955 [Acidimicrobiales bacterium]